MNYQDAVRFIETLPKPEEISCLSQKENQFFYDQTKGLSIVPEVNFIRAMKFTKFTDL